MIDVPISVVNLLSVLNLRKNVCFSLSSRNTNACVPVLNAETRTLCSRVMPIFQLDMLLRAV